MGCCWIIDVIGGDRPRSHRRSRAFGQARWTGAGIHCRWISARKGHRPVNESGARAARSAARENSAHSCLRSITVARMPEKTLMLLDPRAAGDRVKARGGLMPAFDSNCIDSNLV